MRGRNFVLEEEERIMSRYSAVAMFVALAVILAGCTTVPITGRKQLDLIPDSEMMSMSFQQYDEFLKSNKVSDDREKTEMVKKVGVRIQGAVERYFRNQGMSAQLRDYRWEFNLIESDEVNAWCMPGGKVVVYTGLLPVAKTEAGLAVVMGHEIAHAVAKHGDERMSQALLAQMGGMALSEALKSKPEKTQELWLSVYGVGATVGVLLPYSRTQESEADHLGLIFMAMAGYDPNEAIDFWERMTAQKEGAAPPELLSTHPSDATRINNLKKLVPEAMQYYQQP
jgi:predicted Zn-dependent protease